MSFFWLILRTIALPSAAYFLLRDTALGEQGTILAIGIALLISTVFSVGWSALKILGNTLLLKGKTVIKIVFSVILQIVVVLFVWIYYFSNFTNFII